MLGFIAGDIIGSTFEAENHRSMYFEFFRPDARFTDDTVIFCSVKNMLYEASLSDILVDFKREKFAIDLKSRLLPFLNRGFGNLLYSWLVSNSITPYNSLGNVSLIYAAAVFEYSRAKNIEYSDSVKILSNILTINYSSFSPNSYPFLFLQLLYKLCLVDSIEGKILLINSCFENVAFKDYLILSENLKNNLTAEITFNAIIYSIAKSNSLEESIQHSVSLGGDTDTITALTGFVAELIYGLPKEYIESVNSYFRLFDNELLINKDF